MHNGAIAQHTMDNLSRHSDRLASEFVRHEACETCGSSDAKSVYSDGHAYCFACEPTTPQMMSVTLKGSREGEGHPGEEARALEDARVSARRRVRSTRSIGMETIYDTIITARLVRYLAAKSRPKINNSGTKETQMDLFTGSIYSLLQENGLSSPKESSTQPVVLSACQDGRWFHYLPGPRLLRKAIKKNLELLQGYEDIVLFFDNDEPGRKAAEECAGVLPPGRCALPV